jgi:hypothetical protein
MRKGHADSVPSAVLSPRDNSSRSGSCPFRDSTRSFAALRTGSGQALSLSFSTWAGEASPPTLPRLAFLLHSIAPLSHPRPAFPTSFEIRPVGKGPRPTGMKDGKGSDQVAGVPGGETW